MDEKMLRERLRRDRRRYDAPPRDLKQVIRKAGRPRDHPRGESLGQPAVADLRRAGSCHGGHADTEIVARMDPTRKTEASSGEVKVDLRTRARAEATATCSVSVTVAIVGRRLVGTS